MTRIYIPNLDVLKFSILILLSFSCRQETLFRSLSSQETGVDFVNIIEDSEAFNIEKHIYWYNGGGVAIGDVNNDGYPDIYFSANQASNKLYMNLGGLKFEDRTEAAGVGGDTGQTHWTTGVTMVDINNDGWLDIYVCQIHDAGTIEGGNKLYVNNGDGSFTEQAGRYGLDAYSYAQHAVFFDYDLDGDLDMFLLNQNIHPAESIDTGEKRLLRDSLAGDRLYENRSGIYVDVSENAGIYGGAMGCGMSVGIGDINNDKYPDIYVANDSYENDYIYYNQGDGTFEENIRGSINHSSYLSKGNDIADFNNDGLLDIITLDINPDSEAITKSSLVLSDYGTKQAMVKYGYHYQEQRNMLQVNRGNLIGGEVQFSELGAYTGIAATGWSWASLLADFDLDGKKDLFISNGVPRNPMDLDYLDSIAHLNNDMVSQVSESGISLMPEGLSSNKAYKNSDYKFIDKTGSWGLDLKGVSNGAAYSDLDNDGDLDLVLNNLNTTAVIYENTASDALKHHFIKIRLEGRKGNLSGIGARVVVEVSSQKQIQELSPVRGWLSSVDHHLVFGVGDASHVDRLEVDWKDGKRQILENLESNQTITLKYNEAVVMRSCGDELDAQDELFENITRISGIDFRHEENDYIDFEYDKLMPRMLSRSGPKMSVGDVNGDGLEDFYIGGAKNQPGKIYLQQASGEIIFKTPGNNTFYRDRGFEDVGSVLFDVDGDDDLDLYVVSGGGEFYMDYTLTDRLYINDGTGNFSRSNQHPQLAFNGSCVVVGDINQDGNEDLFVGGRSIPGSYGKYPKSRILLGDGNGRLYDATARAFGDRINLGMVTDAVWLDESKELIVVGDFLPVTVLSFRGGEIQESKLDHTSGWWNTIEAADLDGDGDKDLLLGNMGLNSNLKVSVDYPVNLYVKDFDNNGSIDPILSYYHDGIEHTYFGRDELADQLVAITKAYPTYKRFANSTFKDIFPIEELKGAGRWQAHMFESIYLENKGEGTFIPGVLPKDLQIAPLHGFIADDLDEDGQQEILAVGNFFGNQGSIGKLDASYGHYLKRSKEGKWLSVKPKYSGFVIRGEARDIKILNSKKGEKIILVSRNNAEVVVFRLKKEVV